MTRNQEDYNEQQVRSICRELLEVIQHCHAQDVCHRNLQPKNILISSDNRTIKLAGFDLACNMAHGLRDDRCGEPPYIAPEVVRSEPHGKVWYCMFLSVE